MATDSASRPATTSSVPPRRQIWQLPTFVLGVAAVIAVFKFFPPQPTDPKQALQREISTLRAAIAKRPVDANAIRTATRALSSSADRHPEEAPTIHFLLGSAHQTIAESISAEHAAEEWAKANTAFAKCDVLKLQDPLDQQRCVFRSAKAAAAVGVGDAKLLAAALSIIPQGEEAGDRSRLLSESLLRTVPPDWKRARDELAAYLSGPNNASNADQAKYKLKLGELCLSLNEIERARTWLKEINGNAPPEVQALAKVQLGRLAASENNWIEAVKQFEAAQATPGVPNDQVGMIRYESGRGWLALSNPASALPYFEQAVKAGGPVAVAARLRLAEMAIRDPAMRGNRSRAAEMIALTTQEIPKGSEFRNSFVSLDELRAGFEEVIQVSLNESDFAAAQRAIGAFTSITLPGRDRERKAELNAAWANALERNPEKLDLAKAKRQEAADDFLAIANEQTTPSAKADLFRRAITCLRKAGDERGALAAIEQLLAVQGAGIESLASARIEKGEILLASHKFTEAAETLKLAISGGGSLATVAQVKLARGYIDEGKLKLNANTARDPRLIEEAKGRIDLGQKILMQVVNKTYETNVEREAQQEALFELGKISVHQDRNYSEAEIRFRQLIEANPAGAYAEDAKLYLGTCLLLTARSDSGAPPLDAERKLVEAHGLFESLKDSKRPTIQTQADLRIVRSLFLLRRYDAMPELCAKLATKYKGRVEELIVLSMLYWGYKQADRPKLSDEVLVRMEGVYQSLPDQAFTGLLDEYKREYWEKIHVPALTRKK